MSQFKIGDKVTWMSQSGSYEKVKTGIVVMTSDRAIDKMPFNHGQYPAEVAKRHFPDHKHMFDGMQWASGGIFVEVVDTKRGKPKLYMPRSKGLQKVNQ